MGVVAGENKDAVRTLRAAARNVLRFLGMAPSAVEVFLLNRKEMQQAGAFLGKNTKNHIPDVLSFPEPAGFPHPEARKKFLGEVYLNRNLARDEGRMVYLLVHGILHLMGYTHDAKRDTLKMEKLEDDILARCMRRRGGK